MSGLSVHLVDGTYELFRAYYGAPPASAPDGREVGAVRVLARSLLSLVRREGATHVGVAFDTVIESFRNELFDGYKTGDGIDPPLRAQFGLAEDAAEALGFTVWRMIEHEADDALATAAARAASEPAVERVLVCSPDKDLAQCVVGERVVCVDRRRGLVLDDAGVRAKFGVAPESIPDWLALVGDAADGLPGVPRWGPRSAALVLGRWGHLEKIPADPARWDVPVRGAAGLAARLAEAGPAAYLWRRLATLRTDAPIDASLETLRWRGPRPELDALAASLGDEELAERARGV